jgi:hypothetical protein
LHHSLPAHVFKSKINIGAERIKYMKGLTRTDKAHLVELRKAQKTIEVARHEEEKGEVSEEEDQQARLQLRPNTPIADGIRKAHIKREDEIAEQELLRNDDQKQKAIILL